MNSARMRISHAAPLPVADYAHAVEVPLGNGNSLLYLCGMGPRDKRSNAVPGVVVDGDGKVESYNFEAQARNVFSNIEAVIKEMGGRGFRDLIDVQVFLVDIPRDFETFNKLWREYMVSEDGWMPARTTVQVAALPLKEIFVELKCVALLERAR